MPKQGRRIVIGPNQQLGEAPTVEGGEEWMPTQEHVAALEGLAESFEAKADDRRGKFTALANRDAAKEVRNLIEQGRASESTELHQAEQLQEDVELGGGSE